MIPRWFVAVTTLALVVAACGDNPADPTPPAPSTTASSMNGGNPTSTTSTPQSSAVDYTVTGCTTPPVGFALLCEVYEYLDENHVDAPLDNGALAAGFALGVGAYESTSDPDAPGDFHCAIPAPEFESACRLIAEGMLNGTYSIDEAVEDGVASMITLSLDPFTYYLPPELSGAVSPDGVIIAVGLLLRVTDPVGSTCAVVQAPCRLEVVTVLPDSPASRSGLAAGDVVVGIDGEPVAGSDLVAVATRLDGQTGTSVEVDLVNDSGEQRTIDIERRQPVWPALEVEVPRPGLGYLRIPDFAPDIPLAVHAGLMTLQESAIDRLVVDLRDNPGGLVDVVTLVASEFLTEGLVFRSVGPAGDLDYPVQPGGVDMSGIDLNVVVNAGSASAAEILAAVLQETGRATILGVPTFGKNTVQIGFPLRNDGELRVTIARWLTPAGASVAIHGVIPDVSIEIPEDASPAEVVDLALEG